MLSGERRALSAAPARPHAPSALVGHGWQGRPRCRCAVSAASGGSRAAAAPPTPISSSAARSDGQQQHEQYRHEQQQLSMSLGAALMPWRAAEHSGASGGGHAELPDAEAQRLWPQRRPAAATRAGSASPRAEPQTAAPGPSWRVLRPRKADAEDRLSLSLAACSSARHLQQLAEAEGAQLRSSRLHAARLAVMAALIADEQPAAAAGAAAGAAARAGDGSDDGGRHELAWSVLRVLVQPGSGEGQPALLVLSATFLAETLCALDALALRAVRGAEQQQQFRRELAACLSRLPEQNLLSALHACGGAEQLGTVVACARGTMGPVHVKAALVQLARMQGASYTSGSSGGGGGHAAADAAVAGELLALLREQLPLLQPHHAAAALWSVAQLQPLAPSSPAALRQLGRQLLAAALAGVQRLGGRVCAMLLHGAARLELQLLDGEVAELLQHTEQQLGTCDPQALSVLLWSLAALGQPPTGRWLGAFYQASLPMMQPRSSSAYCSSSGGAAAAGAAEAGDAAPSSGARSGQGAPGGARRNAGEPFIPQELAAMLSGLAQLEVQPPAAWLAAAARSCGLQLQLFGHQELALMLWSFAKLRHAPPAELLDAAAGQVQQQLGGFSPQSTTLVLYAASRLQLQPQDTLLDQLWSQLKQASGQERWPAALEGALQELQEPRGADSGAVGGGSSGASGGSGGSSGSNAAGTSSSLSSSTRGCSAPAEALGSACTSWLEGRAAGSQLLRFNAQDLALLVWSMARQQQQQQPQQQLRRRQQRRQQKQQQTGLTADWLASFMAAATPQLQRGAFTGQGLAMMLWGLGMLAEQAPAGAAAGVERRTAAAFWAAAEAQCAQRMAALSGHELACVLWGGSALAQRCHLAASHEVADALACQCLDSIDVLSGYQLLSALQGLARQRHPRGADLLQAALSERSGAWLSGTGLSEQLVLLRACVLYRHVPQAASRAALLGAVAWRAASAPAHQVAQVLYLLGKMQQHHHKQRRRQALLQAAAATAAAAGDDGAGRAGGDAAGKGGGGGGDARWLPRTNGSSQGHHQQQHQHQQQQQQQQQQVHAWCAEPIAPSGLVCELAGRLLCRLGECSPTDVALMLWGLSQLAGTRLAAGVAQAGEPASPRSDDARRRAAQQGRAGPAGDAVGRTGEAERRAPTPAAAFADCSTGLALLDEVYGETRRRLDGFQPHELAALLHAVHGLGVLSPPAEWVDAVVGRLTPRLGGMSGQSLAALAAALASFNWSPPQAWAAAFVDAALSVERAGRFATDWQHAAVRYGLSALDPVAGQLWLQRAGAGGGCGGGGQGPAGTDPGTAGGPLGVCSGSRPSGSRAPSPGEAAGAVAALHPQPQRAPS